MGSKGPGWEQSEERTVGEAAVWEGGREGEGPRVGPCGGEGKGGEERWSEALGGSAGNGPGGAGRAAGPGRALRWCWWLFLYNGQVVKT